VDNLDSYVKTMAELGYQAKAHIGFGTAATEIAKFVNNNDVDFIVMGSHGHKALKDLIFGTTVNTVRHKVRVPVLVVKSTPK